MMPMPPVFWGLIVSPLFGAISLLASSLLFQLGLPWAYAIEGLGIALATALIVRIDATTRRPGIPAMGWKLAPPAWLLAAAVAGIGAAILGSELDNIVRDRFPIIKVEGPPPTAPKAMLEPGPPIVFALSHGLVIPMCYAIVGLGIAMRNLLAGLPYLMALGFGALATIWTRQPEPIYWVPALFAPLLAGWAYAQTRSLFMALAALLPSEVVIWLMLWEVNPKIPGFDLAPAVPPLKIEFQPLWFDGIGVLALCGGVFYLIRAIHQLQDAGTDSSVPPSESTPGPGATD